MEFPKIQAAIQGRGQQNSASSFQQFRGEVHGKTSRFINDEKGLLTSRGLCWNKRDHKSSRKSTDVYSNIRWSVIYVWTRLSFFVFFPRASERRVLLKVGSAYFHIFTSSHLHIFTTSHPYIFTSSRPHIITSSHLHILTSSHLHIFTSSYPHICTSSHLHIHIFTSSHLHIFTSSHPHILTFSLSFSLSLSLSFSLSLSLSLLSVSLSLFTLSFFFFLSLGRGQCRRRITKRQPSRTKRGSSVQNCGKIAIASVADEPFTHETRFECQKLR